MEGRVWVTSCLLDSYFSVTPLHCSTPCRSWEGAVLSYILSSASEDTNHLDQNVPAHQQQHQHTLIPAVLCICPLSGTLRVDVLVLKTSQSSRPDSFLVERMTSRIGGLFIHRCTEGVRDRWAGASHNALGYKWTNSVPSIAAVVRCGLALNSGLSKAAESRRIGIYQSRSGTVLWHMQEVFKNMYYDINH